MNRIRGGAAFALGAALLLGAGGIARAQEITGRVTGRVSDQYTNMPLGGVTVVLQGPQGEDATLTDDTGEYHFSNLKVGTYVIRFYAANSATQVEQGGVQVAADKMVRVNAKLAATTAVQPSAQQTYVITGKPPVVDIGSARVGANFDEKYLNNVPLGRNYGDVIDRAPGAFVDPSGNVSIAGATGLENIYIVNGLNVTGIEFGNLETGAPSFGGGTNLPIEFLTQMDVSSGGYQAEYGGGMGGVINSVLKSGSNEWHGSAFSYWSPYWFSKDPTPVTTVGGSLGYVRKPDFDQHRRRGGRSDHPGQAVLLGRLRAPLPGQPRVPPDVHPGLRSDDGRRRPGRERQPDLDRERLLAGAHPRVAPGLFVRRHHGLHPAPRASPEPGAERHAELQRPDAVVQPHRVQLQPGLGPGGDDPGQHRLSRPLDLAALRPQVADRGDRGHAQRVLQ
jgi:hypothetical protein